jgi:peroxiredoxin
MSVKQVACPKCRKKLGFKPEHLGKRVGCPGCSARFRLPGPNGTPVKKPASVAASAAATAVATKTEARIKATPKKSPRARKSLPAKRQTPWAMIAAVSACVLVVTGVAVAGIRLWKSSPREAAVSAPEVKQQAAPSIQLASSTPSPTPVPSPSAARPSYGGGYGSSYGGYGNSGYGSGADNQIVLKDKVTSNTEIADDALALSFVDSKGLPLDVKQYRGKKNLVLVVTRGFPGYVCPVCSTQTSRLITNYAEFTRRDTEVLLVFPSSKARLPEFVQACQSQANNAPVPFPILLDEDFRVVDKLGIKADLAKPSTYILDKKGQVRFAYVGATAEDRPSVKAMLEQLDALGRS